MALAEFELATKVGPGGLPVVVRKADSLAITAETYTTGAEFLHGLIHLRRDIDDTFDPSIAASHRSHQEALKAKRKHTDPLDEAESIMRGKFRAYHRLPDALPPPAGSGIAALRTYKVVVEDIMALVRAVAARTVAPEALLVNTGYLSTFARAKRGAVKVPGVSFTEDVIISVR